MWKQSLWVIHFYGVILFFSKVAVPAVLPLLSNLLAIVFIWFQCLQSDRYEVVSCFNLYFPDYTEIEYIFMCFDQLELFGWVACLFFFSLQCSFETVCVCVCVCVYMLCFLLLVVLLYTSRYVTSLFTLFMNILNCSVISLPNLLRFFSFLVWEAVKLLKISCSKNFQFLYLLSFLTHLEFYFCICWEVHIFLQNGFFLTLWFLFFPCTL